MFLPDLRYCQTCAILDLMDKPKKNPAAVALAKLRAKSLTAARRQEIGRSGGLIGGKARARKLTAKQRIESARNAAKARWAKKKTKAGK